MTQNGNDAELEGEETGRPMNPRELLARVDERSMTMLQGLEHVRSEVRGFRQDVRRDLLLLGTRIESLESALQDTRRSADESGEHLGQELENLRSQLAVKEIEALEKERDAERAERERLEKERDDAAKDIVRRRRDLVLEVVKWAIIGILAFVVSHLVWK